MGKFTGEGSVRDLDPKTMAQMMMGTATLPEQAKRETVPGNGHGEPALASSELTADDETGVPALRGRSLQVRPHEIVGSPAFPATASASWSRCWAASGAERRRKSWSTARPIGATPRGNPPAPFSRPARNAAAKRLRRRHDDRPKTSPSAHFDRRPHDLGTLVSQRSGHPQPGVEPDRPRYNVRPPWPTLPIRTSLRAATCSAPCWPANWPTTYSAGRGQSLFRPRLQIGRGDSFADHAGPKPRGRGAAGVGRPRRDFGVGRPRVWSFPTARSFMKPPIEQADRQVIGRHMAGH